MQEIIILAGKFGISKTDIYPLFR